MPNCQPSASENVALVFPRSPDEASHNAGPVDPLVSSSGSHRCQTPVAPPMCALLPDFAFVWLAVSASLLGAQGEWVCWNALYRFFARGVYNKDVFPNIGHRSGMISRRDHFAMSFVVRCKAPQPPARRWNQF